MKNNLIALCFLFSFFTFITPAYATTFAGGDGSVGAPYQIETCTQLQGINEYLTSNFILNNDINCYDTINWNNGAGFTQIGSWLTSTTFTGIFDGNHYAINDLFMAAGNTGLFGVASGTLRNFGLNNVKVYSPSYAYLGGAVGSMLGGTLSQVYVNGEVTGISYTGGLVGWHSGGQISDSYARVKVSATYSGGLVGRNDSSTIANSYATGSSTPSAERGLIGFNFGGSSINSFYDGQLMGLGDTNGGSTPKTTSQMKSVATFTATSTTGLTTPWDFVGNPNNDVANADIWSINPLYNNGYPYFTWQTFDVTAPTITNITSTVADGTYKPGNSIPITITFSEPVTSTGSVTLTFETGATDQTCTFTVDHNTIATCAYTVLPYGASSDLDVTLSGTLTDRWGNAMVNFVPTLGLAVQKNIVIDTTVPVVSYGPTGGGSSVTEEVAYLLKAGNVALAKEIQSQWPSLFASPVASIVPSTTTSKTVVVFTKNLSLGMIDSQVILLQQFLNEKGYAVTQTGPGSKGKETNRFGPATKAAVIKYQKAMKIAPSSGYVGVVTRGSMN